MMIYALMSIIMDIGKVMQMASKLIKSIISFTPSSTSLNILHVYHIYLFTIAVVILSFVAWYDLKTSLIWDLFPILLFVLSLIAHMFIAIYTHSWFYLWYPFAVGGVFLILGKIFYYAGQWGEGDVYVLAALIFSIPFKLYFFNFSHLYALFGYPYYIVIFFINLSVFGALYSLIYAIVYASIKNREFFRIYLRECRKGIKHALLLEGLNLLLFLLAYVWKGILLTSLFIYLTLAIFSFYALFMFAKLADSHLFTLHLPLRKVKEGDTVMGSFAKAGFEGKLLDAISQEQIQKLREIYGPNKKVIVKDMVRYAPAFLIALILTALLGDWLVLLIVS